MPTETPAPPTGPEVRLTGKPRSGDRAPLPNAVLSAINAEVAKNALQDAAAPEPSKDPTPPKETPPAPKVAQPEPSNPTPPPPAPAKEPPKSDKEENLANLRKKLEQREAEFAALQNSLTATTKEKADALQKMADVETRVNKLAEEIEKDYKPRAERLKVVEQELQQREEILRIKDYTSTNEFHEKYVKPLSDVQGEVTDLLAELTVPDGEGTVRPATMDDFNEVLAARSLNDAHIIAQNKFGPIAPTVVNFRTRLRGLERQRQEAVKNAGLASAEFVKNQQAQMAQHREHLRNSVMAETQRLMAENTVFQIPEDDQETRATLAAATEFADKLIEGDASWTPDQLAKNVAKARVKMIGHDIINKRYEAMKSRVAELEEKLKGYEKSEPSLQPRGGGQPAPAVNGDKPERAKLYEAINAMVK